MDDSVRILIVGGGVAGLATAAFLAREGVGDVLLVERNATFGAEASGQNAAILRTLTEHAETRALLEEGRRFLTAPPAAFSPVPLLQPVGLLLATREAQARAYEALGVPGVRRVAPDELRRLAPHYRPAGEAVLWVPGEGRIDIAALVDGYARTARRGGVELRASTRVVELLSEAGAVRGARLADGTTVRAETTVLAAGGWAGGLGRAAGSRMELEPRRRHLLATAPNEAIDPGWPVIWDDVAAAYARPESGGLLLCGCDETVVDPDALASDPEQVERIARKAEALFPDHADEPVLRLWCGLRTFAPDGRFVVGPDPDVDGLFWVAGLGGHGMGASPAVGRLAASRLLDAALHVPDV